MHQKRLNRKNSREIRDLDAIKAEKFLEKGNDTTKSWPVSVHNVSYF